MACHQSSKMQELKDMANKIRLHSINAVKAGGSGHPTSCCSSAEIISVLFFHTMRYKVTEPRDPSSDRFILSKGHAAPALYAAWAEAGLFPVSDLLNLRKVYSDLEGHPTPRLNFVDVATGSLGQGLGAGAGMAYMGKYYDKTDFRVFCLLGDAESAEGSNWEALAFASYYKLDNFVAIIDVNRLGQSDPTSLQHDLETYRQRTEAFGFQTYIVDGHDVEALCMAFHAASVVKGKPSCILAKTYKGKGCPDVENELNWHGKPLAAKTDAALEAIAAQIVNAGKHALTINAPNCMAPKVDISNVCLDEPPNYKIGQEVAVRAAYGVALQKLARNNSRVIAVDGDVKNSTYSEKIKSVDATRHIECFVAEQNMVSVAMGLACRDRAIVFASTFAAFLSRAYDHIRMGAVSQTNVNFVGSHCGVSIGADGPSQMALEDLAMFRAVPGSTVFYPSDGVSTERAVEIAANTKGICFIRSSRPALPTLYKNDEPFEIGKAKVVRQSSNDQVTVIGCCVTLFESLKAADELAKEGINICVIDPFTVKPIDSETIINAAKQTGNRIITVEDHYPEGGLGEAVMSAVSHTGITVTRIAVSELPRSGTPDELVDKYGLSARCIAKAVRAITGSK